MAHVLRIAFVIALAALACHGGKPAAAPAADPDDAQLKADLDLIEATFAEPPTRGGEPKSMDDVAAEQDKACHDACDDKLFDDKGGNQAAQDQNVGTSGKCHARCGCMQGARMSFIGCMNGAQDESARNRCRQDATAKHAACKTK